MTSVRNITHRLTPEDKIRLFRSLFRGREDVYARRFESRRSGKTGYAPACSNEWVTGVCEKPRIKCAQCQNRRFLPVTDDVVASHLSGRDSNGRDFVMGVYPMFLDETCLFLAADFDKQHWCDDVGAVVETCNQLGLPVAVERSRSGNGGHVWLFFDEAVPAFLARKLGAHILTETMERRPEIGLDSYDRFFPNQDTLPRGGFGNLIALPLQKLARGVGNSVFLDDSLIPHSDQWAFLSNLPKIGRERIEQVANDADRRGRVVGVRLALPETDDPEPWALQPSRRRKEPPIVGPLPKQLDVVLSDGVYIAKQNLPPELINRLVRLAAFQNPEFYKAQAMRLPTYTKPRVVSCAEDLSKLLCLPRGCLADALQLMSDLKINCEIVDKRFTGEPLEVECTGKLRSQQLTAANELAKHDIGILSATTAFGKTVIAAWLIAQRAVNTLVLVHRRQLLDQWIERLSEFLSLPNDSIGRIGGGKKNPTGKVDVAVIQSLVRKGVVDDRIADYGCVIVDECHHLSAYSFEQVIRRAKAKYVTGLSATITRKDGHHPIIFMQCGPVRHHIDPKTQSNIRPFEHTVHVRSTPFVRVGVGLEDARREFHQTYQQLIADESRNQLICEDVRQAVNEGRWPLVLTERNEHLDILANMLDERVDNLIVLRGGLGTRELNAKMDLLTSITEGQQRVLLATGRFIGEGFDDERLDTLFLTLPVSWRGIIAQYAGRLHRLHDQKREVRVYDYADLNVPMLAKMFDRRCSGYEAIGYCIRLPGSAVAGWPSEITLPVDPKWKDDYAATVRRLVRDGVDSDLANLFGHVSRIVKPDAVGEDRARSATEAFLYRRLETLPETKGKFLLNAEIPIAFDGWGRMEVDLFCTEARLVVELDGAQHLGDEDAYRRDRRKDRLLQENGFFVLRFLCEDIGRNLDKVLDTILRALSRASKRSVEF